MTCTTRRAIAAEVLRPLQQIGSAWIYLGATKTGMVYRLKGNPPQAHEWRGARARRDRRFSMHYVTSLEEVLWGITLVAITMAIHGFGMRSRCSR